MGIFPLPFIDTCHGIKAGQEGQPFLIGNIIPFQAGHSIILFIFEMISIKGLFNDAVK